FGHYVAGQGRARHPPIQIILSKALAALAHANSARPSRRDLKRGKDKKMAEGEGFEPPVRFPVQRFSRASGRLPALRIQQLSALLVSPKRAEWLPYSH